MISLLAPLKRWPRRLTSAISRGPSLRAATRCGPPCSTANTWCSDTTQATLSRGRNFASLSSSRTRFFTYHHRPPPPSVSSGSFGYATSRGFSQSAPGYYARYRYRRFGDNVSGAAGGVGGPSPGGYGGWNRGPGTSLIRLLLESRVVWTVVVVGTGFYIFNLETVKETGRTRFNCVPQDVVLKLSERTQEEILQQYCGRILPDHHPLAQMVHRVMNKLIPFAPVARADWKVHVIIDDRNVNAFVTPSGKTFVFSGLLRMIRDEDELAAVLGHEMAHVVANHPAERMSASIVALITISAISMLFDVTGRLPSALAHMIYLLPNSRATETEADRIGLRIMSRACYNPEGAIRVWKRFQHLERARGQEVPQYLSTHPSSYDREENIRGWLPEAEQEFEKSDCDVTTQYFRQFRESFW